MAGLFVFGKLEQALLAFDREFNRLLVGWNFERQGGFFRLGEFVGQFFRFFRGFVGNGLIHGTFFGCHFGEHVFGRHGLANWFFTGGDFVFARQGGDGYGAI